MPEEETSSSGAGAAATGGGSGARGGELTRRAARAAGGDAATAATTTAAPASNNNDGNNAVDSGRAWAQVLGAKLVRHTGHGTEPVDTAEALRGKHVGLYFSAHWCPPCRQFTPRLVDTYDRLVRKQGGGAGTGGAAAAAGAAGAAGARGATAAGGAAAEWEVVLVSLDRSPHDFDEYFSSMPWLAVPFADDATRNALASKFRVAGIPTLVMMAPDTTILSANARAAVAVDPHGANFPWAGVSEPRGFPLPWMMLAILVFWLVQILLLPRSGGKA